jgi:hypothetical protein
MFTHEDFVHKVADIACSRLSSVEQCTCKNVKLAYGAGPNGVRGVTYYDKWGKADSKAPFVEISAFNQSSITQLAGTTIHELAHVLAGWSAGHGPEWKAACEKLGLRRSRAAGTSYIWSMFAPDIRDAIADIPKPDDGEPVTLDFGRKTGPKPCTAAIGTRGGKSRGVGSGSRLRLFTCACEPPLRVRVARDAFDCTCNTCHTIFQRQA